MHPLCTLATFGRSFTLIAILCLGNQAISAEPDPLEPFRKALEDAREQFSIHGVPQGPAPYAFLTPIENGLRALADSRAGELRARTLLELGRTQSMSNAYEAALATLDEAARLADAAALSDVALHAWLGIAKTHIYGTHDYGAASEAIDRAEVAAGAHPDARQQYDMVRMRSVLYEVRGEAEPALIEALIAVRLAQDVLDRYFAHLDAAAALKKIFDRCQKQPLTDTESVRDQNPRWGACNRAMRVTRGLYDQAARDAEQRGWFHLMDIAKEGAFTVQYNYKSWSEMADQDEVFLTGKLFHPKDASSVVVRQSLPMTFSGLPETKFIGPVIDQTTQENRRRFGTRADAQQLALQASRPGMSPAVSAWLLGQAMSIVLAERQSFFDARRRGTVIEGNPGLPARLGLRLLFLHREEEAFDAFEMARARGLGELNQVLARPDIDDHTRQWLAALLMLEVRASLVETRIIEKVIATGKPELVYDHIDELQKLRSDRSAMMLQGQTEIGKLQETTYQPAHLSDLQAAATAAGTSVMLYWSEGTNLVAWYVGAHGSELRYVFVPEVVLRDRVKRVRESAADSRQPFDEEAARELFLFLIAPFERFLDTKQIMIVPTDPLVGLPFETLLVPQSGTPMIDHWAVSYAPNATLAAQALRRPARPIGDTVAVFDPDIDRDSHESAGMKAALGSRLHQVSFDTLLPGPQQSIAGASALHLLLHGQFEQSEPLMSKMFNQSRSRSIYAAEMIGLPLRGLHLAVLSGCETGQVGLRVSNEIYGFPWALMAGGVDSAVVSRWLVDATSNEAWMREFYHAAASGLSPAQAAAEAMRRMRAAGTTHPRFWAAMQVIGR
jgi:CHAT domain-containing protein